MASSEPESLGNLCFQSYPGLLTLLLVAGSMKGQGRLEQVGRRKPVRFRMVQHNRVVAGSQARVTPVEVMPAQKGRGLEPGVGVLVALHELGQE
jgi:hypothetical protein